MTNGRKSSLASIHASLRKVVKCVGAGAVFATWLSGTDGNTQVFGGTPGLPLGTASQGAALATQQRVIPPSVPGPPVSIPPVGNPLSQSTLPPYPDSISEVPLWRSPADEYGEKPRRARHARKKKGSITISGKSHNNKRSVKELHQESSAKPIHEEFNICRGC
jgi:hypothetical protein